MKIFDYLNEIEEYPNMTATRKEAVLLDIQKRIKSRPEEAQLNNIMNFPLKHLMSLFKRFRLRFLFKCTEASLCITPLSLLLREQNEPDEYRP